MSKKLECIKRMMEKERFYEFTEWLIEHKISKKDDFIGLNRNKERAEYIYEVLNQAVEDEKLQLLDFEWILLPKEVIKIMCVTLLEKKVFTYGF